MPTIGAFHGFYWMTGDAAPGPPAGGVSPPVYGTWQASVVVGSLFGAIGARWDAFRAAVRYWWGLKTRIERLDGERRAVLFATLDLLESVHFPRAQVAVRETATTLGFTRPEAWLALSRAIKADPGRAQNVFRHLEAMRRLRVASDAAGEVVSNPVQNFAIELAYQGFARMGK